MGDVAHGRRRALRLGWPRYQRLALNDPTRRLALTRSNAPTLLVHAPAQALQGSVHAPDGAFVTGRAELFRALGVLCEPPDPAHRALAEAIDLPGRALDHEHTDVFLFQLYPYASVYLGAEGMLGGEARDRVAGFWRALELSPPAEPDHLAALLSLYASLMDAEQNETHPARRLMRRESRKALLWEHLLIWLPAYIDKMKEIAPPFYEGWAEVLESMLVSEATALESQEGLPLHLRSALAEVPSLEGGKQFISWLLAPVRSGMVLVRSDLQRATANLGLGLRVGERRWVLESLLGQDPEAILSWLASETRRWAGLHRRWLPVTGDVARFWIERAEAAESVIGEALAEARSLVAPQT
ncbi:MAG: hypothetical protein GEU28_14265 [Dehalococcoidia bacterium]|nr:hypothetical protein [Dehalococcoidia bacterium]